MQIKVYETVVQQPNGDRDTRLHDCSSFTVELVNGNKRTKIFHNDQFDRFHCHINGTRAEYLKEAMKAAEDMAATLGSVEIVGVEGTKHESRAKVLRAMIAQHQKELNSLVEKYHV